MPAADADLAASPAPETYTALPFPPIKKSSILNCSVHYWYPRYRGITPKARLIPLTTAFVSYLREDGIFVPPDNESDDKPESEKVDVKYDDPSSTKPAESKDSEEGEGDDEEDQVSLFSTWRDVHLKIKTAIDELGGKVAPKLNWSAPKDAVWINAGNSMECRSPSEIYLLLKASDFITHDLEHAFDGCVEDGPLTDLQSDSTQQVMTTTEIPYHMLLRQWLLYNPAFEFRCFVRYRKILGICQRDLNHFDYLFEMKDELCDTIQKFFDKHLEDTFPDENFAFDVYMPYPHQRVWLVDFNPWAPRTDPLLFSWKELLDLPEPPFVPTASFRESFARLSMSNPDHVEETGSNSGISGADKDDEDEDVEVELFRPDFRLITKDDPEAYRFNSPQYSAHKLPKDVVDASQGGAEHLMDVAEQMKEMMERREEEDSEDEHEDAGDEQDDADDEREDAEDELEDSP